MSLPTIVFLLLAFPILSTNPLGAEGYDPISPPEAYRQSLLNGMEILFLTRSDERVPFVFMIKNGAVFDPIEKWGITYLTTLMIFEQRENLREVQIQRGLQELNADLNFGVEGDAIYFFGSTPREHLVDTLNLLAEMVVRPVFNEEDFQQTRQRVILEIEVEQQHLGMVSQDLFLAELFQVNPYAHSVRGTTESLSNLSLGDVRTQYRKLFMPNQAQLAVYHSGDRNEIFSALSRHWGSWIRRNPLSFTFRQARPPPKQRLKLLDWPSGESLFRWGSLGVERGSRDYYALKVFQQYLTLCLPTWATQVASRNQIQASSELEAGRMPGFLQLNVQAPPHQLIAYYQKFEVLAKELQEGQIDDQKFEEAKRLAYLEMTDSLSEPLSALYQLLETGLYNVGINYLTNYGLRLERVTLETFQNAVRKYVSLEHSVLVVVGPVQYLRAELARIGKGETPR
ncbi:MAG: insulinase family protein [Acidobacteria bacterium]|nr:MAG: insulinase family protein [Acidobacteriota bacterium]